MNKCIITGCDLFVEAEGKTLHGDLHEVGDSWTFNGVIHDGQAAWNHRSGLLGDGKFLVVTGDYWERRGVVVIPKDSAHLNSVALAYVGRYT